MKISGSMNGLPISGTDAYMRSAEQAAWRKEMLARVLEQVREAQPRLAGRDSAPDPAASKKGRLINVYI